MDRWEGIAEGMGEEGNWCVNCEAEWWWLWCGVRVLGRGTGELGVGAARRLEGAADWTVVRVVVRERREGAGEVKVLPSPPPIPLLTAPPAVAMVPGFEFCPSEVVVSGLVETVGATDFWPMMEACWPSWEIGMDVLLCVGEES